MGFAIRWGGARQVVAITVENGIRVAVPLSAAATANYSFQFGNTIGQSIFLGEGAIAEQIDLTSEAQNILQEKASETVEEVIDESQDLLEDEQ
jgi:hypothetical protein